MFGRIIVIGASSGGVSALQALAAQLPASFPAPILAVQHIGSHRSLLPSLLRRRGPLPAAHGEHGEPIVAGRIYVAPSDHHMLVEDHTIRLARGPKEHHARPAIDPLFRSAALAHGPSVIGVVLTGYLDDGTAGLQAIKRRGGVAVVQDPDDAEMPSMPESALRHVHVDHRVPLAAMGALLATLAESKPREVKAPAAAADRHENDILLDKGDFMEHLRAIAEPSTYTCPDCSGTLWRIRSADPPRFRCHTGHAYTMRTLAHAQGAATDEALWSALRALQERETLLAAMGEEHSGEIERLRQHAATVRNLITGEPAAPA
jgi:two-component system, chemotaxis family, protein-glutamate methylesterase/glutaminase